METKLLAELLMLCGALHDIAEKSREPETQRQLNEAQDSLQNLGMKYLPVTMLKIRNNG